MDRCVGVSNIGNVLHNVRSVLGRVQNLTDTGETLTSKITEVLMTLGPLAGI